MRGALAALAAAVCLGLCAGRPAHADQPLTVHTVDASVTVTTSSAPCVTAPTAGVPRLTLAMFNSGTNDIGYSLGTAALGSAGTIRLKPDTGFSWGPGTVPKEGFNCIAANASTPLTVTVGTAQ